MLTDAVIKPNAVVVKRVDALVAHHAMLRGFKDLALATVAI